MQRPAYASGTNVARVFSLRSFWLPVLLVTLVVAAFGAVLGRHGRQLRAMLAKQGVLTDELARLRSENARLRAERDALLSSAGSAERVAREDFGFAGPGEKVSDFQASADARVRPSGGPESGPSAWQKALMWPGLPRVLPATAFVVTAVVFGLLNAVSAARAGRAR